MAKKIASLRNSGANVTRCGECAHYTPLDYPLAADTGKSFWGKCDVVGHNMLLVEKGCADYVCDNAKKSAL